ncbi:MAG: exonuclease SbcCD subunit D [Oscillospiraceae bacterium]
MKIFHTADWHIGKILKNYSLIKDQKYYFEKFIEDLKNEQPDALIIAGDLYDRSIPSAEAITLLNDILSKIVLELKIETFIIAGNHDSKERLSFAENLLDKSGLHIAGTLSNEMKKFEIGSGNEKTNIFLMPFIEPYCVKNLYKNADIKTHDDAVNLYCKSAFEEINTDEINILVAHGLFRIGGDKMEKEEQSLGGSDMVDATIFSDFDYVALGHLHSHLTIGSPKMLYSGSPLKYSIDETLQKKSYTIINYTNKNDMKITTKEIKPLHDVLVIEGDFEYLSNRENFDNLDDYVFANITDEKIMIHSLSRLKAVFQNIIGLKYINQSSKNITGEIQKISSINQKNEIELFADFYKSCCDYEINDNEIDTVSTVFSQVKQENNLKGDVANDTDNA